MIRVKVQNKYLCDFAVFNFESFVPMLLSVVNGRSADVKETQSVQSCGALRYESSVGEAEFSVIGKEKVMKAENKRREEKLRLGSEAVAEASSDKFPVCLHTLYTCPCEL